MSSRHYFLCELPDGTYVEGHREPLDEDRQGCHDAWDHIEGWGTHVAMVWLHHWSGLRQGAGEYLRWRVRSQAARRSADELALRRVRRAIEQFDAAGDEPHP